MSDGEPKSMASPTLTWSRGSGSRLEKYPNILNILKLGTGFFFTFAAYINAQNLMPQVLKELGYETLGFVCLAVLYASFGISCVFAPGLLKYCNERHALAFATIWYTCFSFCGVLPASCAECSSGIIIAVMVSASVLVGWSGGFLWVAQGAILAKNSPQYHVDLYASVFQTVRQSGLVVGPLVASALVSTPLVFFIVMGMISLVGTLVLTTIRPPTPHPSIPLHSSSKNESLRHIIEPMSSFVRTDPRARRIAIYAMILGVMYTAASCVVPMFAATNQQKALLFTLQGVGNFTGALSFARLSGFIGRRLATLLASSLTSCALVLFVLSPKIGLLGEGASFQLALVASFALGTGNSIHFTNLSASIVAAVHDKAGVGFATSSLINGFTSVVAFSVLPILSYTTAVAVCFTLQCLCTVYLLFQRSFYQTLVLPGSTYPESKETTRAADLNDMDVSVAPPDGKLQVETSA